TVLYVTGRARQLRKRTVSWLFRYGYPRGPIYFLNPTDFPTYDVVAFKKSVLVPLKKVFPGMQVGIGNDPDDVEAYQAAGLKSLLLVGKPIKGATCVPDWSKVEGVLSKLEEPIASPKR
ncbi:MAG: hypothetical protein HY815_08400, partial [Candidatus Riflebacteria bacterium]|nr:hypothetical protein [Candidatus Riflebacteria bacterium]